MSEPKKNTKLTRAVEHIVRTADGRFKKLRLTRKLAMAAMCTECMGFGNPADCTAILCPLYPFRAKTFATSHGNITSAQLAEMQKAKKTPADGGGA